MTNQSLEIRFIKYLQYFWGFEAFMLVSVTWAQIWEKVMKVWQDIFPYQCWNLSTFPVETGKKLPLEVSCNMKPLMDYVIKKQKGLMLKIYVTCRWTQQVFLHLNCKRNKIGIFTGILQQTMALTVCLRSRR